MTEKTDGRIAIRPCHESDQGAVIELWRECGLVVAWNGPASDIRRKLRVQRGKFLVGLLDSALVATVMAGYEGHRGWINNLAVKPELRRQGLDRRLMAEAEARLTAAGCPKVNLQVRNSNAGALAFYERIGYSTEEVVSMGKRLKEDQSLANQAGSRNDQE